MTECTQTELSFPSCKSKKVSVDFSGGNISSFGGAVLLRQADRQTGLLHDAARKIPDPRRQASVLHSVEQMLRQRVFAVACGEEDLNDHDELRKDIALQTALGSNPRFIVTSLSADAQGLYDDVYCARGNMENRIKEQQLDLYADRTSSTNWWANQFRLLLSSMAYVLFDHIRRIALKNTRLAHATSATIRNKLIRIGAVVLRNTRRIRLHLSSPCPHQHLFAVAASRLE